MKRIILTGYMGAGKTTTGRSLASAMGLRFYDLDWCISSRRRKSINDLFTELGEDRFREIEREMLHEVCEFEDVVISCGGGTPCFFDNIEYMNRQGDTIYIRATTDSIFNRLTTTHNHNQRPLVAGLDVTQLWTFITQQMAEREKFYLQSKYILDADGTDFDKKILKLVTLLTSESS